jgi:hypothetical protein
VVRIGFVLVSGLFDPTAYKPLEIQDTDEINYLLVPRRHTANKIAEQAEVKIYIGRRVLNNVDRVEQYLNDISE